jgi:hypothetical protein
MAIIDDKFTGEGSDVDLDTHTPDTTGTGWTNIETTGTRSIFVETGGGGAPADVIRAEAAENSDRTIYTAQGTYLENEYDVEIDVVNTDSGDDWAWLIGRLTNSSNYYAAGFVVSTVTDLFLVKKVSNTFSLIGSADTDWSGSVTMKLEIRDAAKKIFIDDVEKVSSSDNTLTFVGDAGVALGNIYISTFDIGAGWDLDNFLVTEAAFGPDSDAFRFYDDGTESGSSPKAAQDTNITLTATGDAQFHLRFRIQETGAIDGASTDDFALEVDKNSGGFAAVTGSSSNVQSDTASGLTADAVTTNRAGDGIADGAGSFVAGEQEETNGVIEDRQLTANNFTEHVWACKLIEADLGAADTLDFRVTLNGGAPGMTNNVLPRITISSGGRIMGSLAGPGGLAGSGGIAGQGGGIAG